MARIGSFKPYVNTYDNMKDIVFDNKEVVFEVDDNNDPVGIKMGDGVRTYENLLYFSGGSKWEYDTGTTEAALLNNLQDTSVEQIGKIYYIKSHFCNGTTENSPVSNNSVPYKVIGINHEGTTNTLDLHAMVGVNALKHGSVATSTWSYPSSPVYTYLSDGGSYQNSLSSDIQACLQTMTERWRVDNGNTDSSVSGSSTMSTRTTKSKLLNPYEIFGSYATSSIKADFTSSYGTFYTGAFPGTGGATENKRYSDLAMSSAYNYWTNSFNYVNSSNSYHPLFIVDSDGNCSYSNPTNVRLVVPAIRLKLS